MKAAIFKGKEQIVIEEVSKPVITKPTDAIVRIVRSCVCGSDLWYYRGLSDHKEGSIGHEFVGIVEELGDAVEGLNVGDFVIAPFAYSDNTCANCENGFQTACMYGGFFGSGGDGKGGQAEFVRVPQAGGTLVAVPGSDFSEDIMKSLLTLSDVMSTGYHAAISAGVKSGDTVAVVGDGAVGLSAVLSAKLLGAERIIIMSKYEARQQLAREWGATDIIKERGEAAVKSVMEMTNNIGVDAVMECVGTKEAVETSFAIARAGSIVGRVGVPHYPNINGITTFFRNVGMRGGPAPARKYIPELINSVLDGSINPGRVFNYTTDIDGIPEAYQAMHERRAIKALINVSEISN